MRIISVRLEPVARIFSAIYGFLGIVCFFQFAFSDAEYLTMPIGIVAPLIYLNFNLKLQRSTNIVWSLFYCIAEIIAYAISGWITGAAAVICFNLVAKWMGGVDARFVSTIDDESAARSIGQ